MILSFLFSLAGCTKSNVSQNNAEARGSEKKVVRLGSATTSNFMGELPGIAQENKYIDEELKKIGYEVEYINFPKAGPAVNEAFVGGSIDFACYGDLPPVVLKSKGQNIKIVGIPNSSLNMDLIVQNDSDIKSVKDIKGKKIIVGKGTVYQQYFGNLVKANGIDEKDVEVLNVVAEGESTFLSKSADGYVVTDAMAQKLAKGGNGRIVATTVDQPEFASQSVLVGRTDYIKENSEVPVALLKALIRAQDFAKKNPEEAYKVMAKSGFSEDIIKESYGYDNGQFKSFNIEITDESINKLKNLNKFLYEQNLISKNVNIDELVDNSYYEKALNELGK
ncbi:ABC-type transporter, periplasmic subunit family 3 [Clostridium sp. DL-VIII]|uniref:ABC transporter substrate-binding protein n=1 Tax=Clostridium sp. DL-VIII TaxID=641107 RepID=UPI00023AF3C1|nr:ABC transporter substrate-binding protein [Clostridium sp. DL-VIII]EHI97194.1 ABC-type transporter, periplasmic subunit family 3 [Clostridium sp. DL-VIII]